ncbi:MAG TPA: hypothetical protein VEI02_11605 [Planctomycetota bacterium]|nr:hypothetical protein [Planctomycetota bacterium]
MTQSPRTTQGAGTTAAGGASSSPPDGDDVPPASVVWHSSLLDLSGYAQVARTLALALDRAGVPVRVEPIWGSMKRVDAP